MTNDTLKAASGYGAVSSPSRGSPAATVVRRKKKANIHLDTDNEIKSRQDTNSNNNNQEMDGGEEQQQRFLSPSVRRYLALGRAIPGPVNYSSINELAKIINDCFCFPFAGRPGTDYPILSQVPYTNFYCDDQEYPGFFADMETRCQGQLVSMEFA